MPFRTYFLQLSFHYIYPEEKVRQYLCFLLKSTILDISLSNCIHELYYVPVYRVINNASSRLHQPNLKIHDVYVLRLTEVFFSHMLFDIERELFHLQLSGEYSV